MFCEKKPRKMYFTDNAVNTVSKVVKYFISKC